MAGQFNFLDSCCKAVLRGLQAALHWVMGFGLERFLPVSRLKPGEPIPDVLEPADVRDRPHLTCAACFTYFD